MAQVDLTKTFSQLKKLLNKHAKGLAKYDEFLGSQAKDKKPALHLYGKPEVSVARRKPQQTYVAGIIEQKNFVGFYHMPVYSHPKKFKLSPLLHKALKGKSCFHIREATPEVLAEVEGLITDGIALYRQEGWI
jgi:hypothetical protein